MTICFLINLHSIWVGMKWSYPGPFTFAPLDMMTASKGNIFCITGSLWGNPPVTGGFTSQKAVSRRFDVFFDLLLNKRLSKQSIRRRFETSSCLLWRHCNEIAQLVWLEITGYMDEFQVPVYERIYHYNDVTGPAWRPGSPTIRVFSSTICQGWCQSNIKAPRDWPFIRRIHRWPMDSPHKGPGR